MTVIARPFEPIVSVGADAPNPWPGFRVGEPNDPQPTIRLEQIGRRTFRLASTVCYDGPTGLDGLAEEAERRIRCADATTVKSTDLASIPGPLRWWICPYGTHTPAALIHDRFIGEPTPGDPGRPDGVSEQAIDRYFRFMLRELGLPFFRRWLMWAAVACRTRLHAGLARRALMILWILAAVFGIGLFVAGVATGDRGLVAISALLPVPMSALWGRQAGAALIIAYVGVPCLLAPTIVTIPFLAIYAFIEAVGKQCSDVFVAPRREGP